jgi:hypothetical protein
MRALIVVWRGSTSVSPAVTVTAICTVAGCTTMRTLRGTAERIFDRLDMRAEARRLNTEAVNAVRQPRHHRATGRIGGDGLVQLIRFAGELECRGDSQPGGVAHHHAELAGRDLSRQNRGGQRQENRDAEGDPGGRVMW